MKKILLSLAIATALISCKKGDEPTPEPTPAAPPVTYTWSHYILTGAGTTLAVHFGDSNSSKVTPFIGRNEIKINGVVFSSFTADTLTGGGNTYYQGEALNVLQSGDTVDVKNLVSPNWEFIYRNGVLQVSDSTSNSLRFIIP
jgi:hypothetical protein